MQLTASNSKIMVSADGTGIVSQAGGLLLTVTGTAGALCYAAWACGDQLLVSVRGSVRARRPAI